MCGVVQQAGLRPSQDVIIHEIGRTGKCGKENRERRRLPRRTRRSSGWLYEHEARERRIAVKTFVQELRYLRLKILTCMLQEI